MSRLTTDTPAAAQMDPRLIQERRQRRLQYILPIAAITFALGMWEFLVWYNEVPHYLIPAPSLIVETLIRDWSSLMQSAMFTVKLTLMALLLAIVGGVALGMVFALSRPIEMSLFPFAVILQVDLCVDRCLFPDPVEYGHRFAQRRP